MEHLNESTLVRLRDKLRERGQRPSALPETANLPASARELLKVSIEYGPLCEAMYLMMAADGRVLNVERAVLKGAMRTLTDGAVRGVHIEALLDTAAKRHASEGTEARLKVVVDQLAADPITSEVAYVLAAAIALADGTVPPEEQALLDAFASELDLEEGQVDALMSELLNEQSRD